MCSWWPVASATSRRRVRMRRSTACAAAPAPAAAQPADGGAPHRSAASVARRRGSTRAVVARPARPLRRIAGSTERTRSPPVAPQAGQLGRVQGGRPCAAQGGRRPSAASSRGPRSLVRFGRRTALHGTMGTTVLALARNRRGLNAGNALGERESREALGRRRALAARGAHGRPGGVRAHATRARAWRASRARASDLTFKSVAKSGDLGHRHLLAK